MDVYQHHPEESPDYRGLKIQKALQVPPSIRSPYFHKVKKRPNYSVDDYVKGIDSLLASSIFCSISVDFLNR